MTASTHPETLDCLVIGGGAAGLMAAVYLGRFRRRVVVVDDAGSRLNMIPRSRNVLGFPDGIGGADLLARMRRHAERFHARLDTARIERLSRRQDGGFDAACGARRWSARFVLLATGARDIEPDIAGLAPSLKAGQVRYCPVCDGFETQGQRVAVLGRDMHGLREACFLADFGNHVTWLSMGSSGAVSERDLARLRGLDVQVEDGEVRDVQCIAGRGVLVSLQGGRQLAFDVMYPAFGLVHASQLATALGARVLGDGQLEVDGHCQTTVDGLYAAGDVAVGLNQINVAAGQAAIAATDIHNRL